MVNYLPLVLTGLGLTASILYYTMVLRNQNKTQQMQLETRQAQLYNNIMNQSVNNPVWMKNYLLIDGLEWKTLEEYLKDVPFGDAESEKTFAMWQVSMFLEGLSPIFKHELIDLSFFFPTFYSLIRSWWRQVEPIAKEAREKIHPGMWGETEYLYKILTKYLEEHPEVMPY